MKSFTRLIPSLITRKHIIGFIGVLAIIILILAAGTYYKKQSTLSKNPIIAQYEQNLPKLATAAEKQPKDAEARQKYGAALYATGDLAKSRVEYEAAVQYDPTNALLRNNLGNVYRDLGETQKAIESYQKSISFNLKNKTTYINLANVYLYGLNQKELAIKTFREGLANNSGDQQLLLLLGNVYERANDVQDAREAYQTILAGNPRHAAAQAAIKRLP